jgi:hypothetical protein
MPGQSYQPKNVRTAQRQLEVVFFLLLGACFVEWIVPSLVQSSFTWPSRHIELILAVFAIGDAVVILYFRYVLLVRLLSSEDGELAGERLAKAFAYYLVCLVCANAVAIYGLLGRIGGVTPGRAAPFYVGAVVLLLLCYPRLPQRAEDESTGPIEPR